MIKITNNTLASSVEALKEISAERLPVKVCYDIGKILKQAEEALGDFESTRVAIVKRHADLDENGEVKVIDGQQVTISDVAAYNAEIIELLNIEVELKAKTIKIDTLGDITSTPSHLAALNWLIVG